MIIIPVSSEPLKMETERREKITNNSISPEQKKLFRWNKGTFSIIFEMLYFGKILQNTKYYRI